MAFRFSINFIIVVMAMMRMVMEVVMVLAIVAGMLFVMRVSAKENNSDTALRENDYDKSADDDS